MTYTGYFLEQIPLVRHVLVTNCHRCGRPDFRPRMEEMPVAFGDGGEVVSETIRFCTICTDRMALVDRVALIHQFAADEMERREREAEGEMEAGR